jgi:hypothetical protein
VWAWVANVSGYAANCSSVVCWQARAFKYLPHPLPLSLFSLPPPHPTFLALRSLRSFALDVARDILHSFGIPRSIVLQYPSQSLLVD